MALRNGSRFPVSMKDVFPLGCCLVPDSISEAQDYDVHVQAERDDQGDDDDDGPAGTLVPAG